ncbi:MULTISPECIES: hypothetical protein [unclassified Gilliamella]|uniref:hypothetical protein n=1 Tax=unclassified Gilliamella TaxID=2685620 RepID=UPI001307878B|nr:MULTISPECIES: hypothetical protein [unclassified Gilliamella]MWP49574.1 hypothetical protein [Gilliamella sp. Lep-s35]MWP69339.1 hypothetical protein [Gilliamella sp. Lep-s5]MWP77608.1 hypothetical protein [Gilliamella sp. Lep-s21]
MPFIEIDPLIAGIMTLGFIYGAYFTETYQPFHAFGIAAVIYLCMSFTLIFSFKKLEQYCLVFQRANVKND